MACGQIRGLGGGVGAASEEAHGALRRAGASVAGSLGGDWGDTRTSDWHEAGGRLRGDVGGQSDARGSASGGRGEARELSSRSDYDDGAGGERRIEATRRGDHRTRLSDKLFRKQDVLPWSIPRKSPAA